MGIFIVSSCFQWSAEGSLDVFCEQKWENNWFVMVEQP